MVLSSSDCEMLVIVTRVMGIIDYKVCTLFIFSVSVVLYDGSLWNNGDSGVMSFVVYG
jgi:hypothetical protein